jgi:hypothetical protein
VLLWRSPFELELGEASPAEVIQRARAARRWRLQGLRVRIRGEQIRARYVVREAAAASLLVARPVQRGSRTYLVGEMRWAAMFVSLFIKAIAPALFGVGLVVWGLADQFWQGTAFGAVLAVTLGWMSVDMRRSTREDQAAEEGPIRESLREALTR